MKLKEFEKEYGNVIVNLALSYVFEKGQSYCKTIRDEDISKLTGSSMIPKETIQAIVSLAREISRLNLRNDIFPYIKEQV